MTHARLTHPTRSTLEFRQAQSEELQRETVSNITAEIGVDRRPLVHTETRDERREIRGRVSAPRRARNDSGTNDWRQALANYVDLLESHVDEFQGDGYQYVNDELGTSKQAILESVSWELRPGQPYDIPFDASVIIGRGVFESKPIEQRNPTVDTGQSTYLVVDGVACPGMRQYQKTTEVGVEPTAIFNRDSAENNDVVPDAGVTERIVFEGTHTGTRAQRASDDAALSDLLATADPITCETAFPGYDLEGYVTAYNSTFEARFGQEKHDYRLEFTVGERA